MTDPLEELQAETARKLVVSLREELAVANERVRQVQADYQYFVEKGESRGLEQAREENVVLAEMVWDAAEFWWERARQFSHEMDTVSELEAMRIHAILSKLYDKVRGTALATHPGPESQEQAVSHYPECPTPENVETSRAPRGRMEVYSERELLSDIREAGPLLDAHLEPVADPQPATPKVLHLDTALRAEPKAPDPEKTCAGVGEFPYLLHGLPTCPTCREHIRAVMHSQITQEQHFPPDPEPTP